MKWLSSKKELDSIFKEGSSIKILFKHSIYCGISSYALFQITELEKQENLAFQFEIYGIDIIQNRPLSNEIAERFKLTHQSPQVLILKNGKLVANKSHYLITLDELKEMLKTII